MFNFDRHKHKFYEEYNYLDYNATTPVSDEVLEAMLPYFGYKFTNPSAKYPDAMSTKDEINNVRDNIKKIMAASEKDQIIFTGSATESINQAIRSTLKVYPQKKHIITSSVEHSAIYKTFKDLQRDGYEIDFISVNKSGELDLNELQNKLRPDTAIVSIMYANNETGVIFPIDKIANIIKNFNKEIIFHTDATQAIGKISLKLNKNGFDKIDLLSMSGHKIYAPKGIGVLYIKNGTKIRPFITGGTQEYNKRAGTQNTPSIIGLGKAFELAYQYAEDREYNDKLRKWKEKLETQLWQKIPYMHINGKNAERTSNVTNIAFDAVEGEAILVQLFKAGIYVSSGSACSSSSLEPSRVLTAMGMPLTAMHSSLRISMGKWTKEEDIDQVIEILPPIIQRLREISPFWDTKNNCPNEHAIQEAGL